MAVVRDGRVRVAFVGSGAWGTTLATLQARREPTLLLARSPETAEKLQRERRNEMRLPGVELPERLMVSADRSLLADADLVVYAVPSAYLRAEVVATAPFVSPDAEILSVAKGLEAGTLLRMSEVIADCGFAPSRVAALSGPNLALEVARGLPASAVVAASDEALAARIRDRLGRRTFRLYTNTDIIGVELCGAFKNVVAIAAGAMGELGFGDNGKASVITRGLAEMMRLGMAAGANPLTFAGLAGVGDLIATCASPLSRNHQLGVALAHGRHWPEIASSLPGVAEGAHTVAAALALAQKLGVQMPIAEEVHAALFEGKSARRCLIDMLARDSQDELVDYERWADQIRATPSVAPVASATATRP